MELRAQEIAFEECATGGGHDHLLLSVNIENRLNRVQHTGNVRNATSSA
jgi:hypothetical protein